MAAGLDVGRPQSRIPRSSAGGEDWEVGHRAPTRPLISEAELTAALGSRAGTNPIKIDEIEVIRAAPDRPRGAGAASSSGFRPVGLPLFRRGSIFSTGVPAVPSLRGRAAENPLTQRMAH